MPQKECVGKGRGGIRDFGTLFDPSYCGSPFFVPSVPMKGIICPLRPRNPILSYVSTLDCISGVYLPPPREHCASLSAGILSPLRDFQRFVGFLRGFRSCHWCFDSMVRRPRANRIWNWNLRRILQCQQPRSLVSIQPNIFRFTEQYFQVFPIHIFSS